MAQVRSDLARLFEKAALALENLANLNHEQEIDKNVGLESVKEVSDWIWHHRNQISTNSRLIDIFRRAYEDMLASPPLSESGVLINLSATGSVLDQIAKQKKHSRFSLETIQANQIFLSKVASLLELSDLSI